MLPTARLLICLLVPTNEALELNIDADGAKLAQDEGSTARCRAG